MGKAAARVKRTTKFKSDPVVDQLAVVNARGMMLGHIIGIGWRLALMVLVPIFVAVQLDKKFDTAPSLSLAAFFIAVFGAGVLIARTFQDITRQQALDDARQAKRAQRKKKRSQNA